MDEASYYESGDSKVQILVGTIYFLLHDILAETLLMNFRTSISTFKSLVVGPVAQWIRHLTTNQGIPDSNPGGVD